MTMAKKGGPEVLSVGALTFCYEKAHEFVYQYEKKVSSKEMAKGIIVEPQSIELYNEVFSANYTKNTERINNAWLSGECDIDTSGKIIDIKSSWSKATFPSLAERADTDDYEWQGRGYMMLWGRPLFDIAYCLVTTPEHLIGYEDESLHYVDHIDESLRVTIKPFERCKDKEDLIKIKCEAAQRQIDKYIEQITHEHSHRG
jgi:hypothetical protein